MRDKSLRKRENTTIRTAIITPIKVLGSFNTWAFKREQPTELALLENKVAEAIASNEQIPFVLYWGKGPRQRASAAEDECLDYLRQMASRIASTYPIGADVKLILTDTHALLNGHRPESISEYFSEVHEAAVLRGFSTCRLSTIVAEFGVDTGHERPLPDVATLDRLEKCAAKWYRGENGVAEAAARYYAMNMCEKEAVGRCFPSAIFITFNGREYRELFPDPLPVFYMYSIRKGISVKPWFADHGSKKLLPFCDTGPRRSNGLDFDEAVPS